MTKKSLELLHTDLFGPMNTESLGGKEYVIIIIDHYSRYTEVYLLRSKSEAAEVMKNYIEMVKTKFNRKPKLICSN